MTKTELCTDCVQNRALLEILTQKNHRLEAQNTELQARVKLLEQEVAFVERGYKQQFNTK
jgi:cell division protein FtsB